MHTRQISFSELKKRLLNELHTAPNSPPTKKQKTRKGKKTYLERKQRTKLLKLPGTCEKYGLQNRERVEICGVERATT